MPCSTGDAMKVPGTVGVAGSGKSRGQVQGSRPKMEVVFMNLNCDYPARHTALRISVYQENSVT